MEKKQNIILNIMNILCIGFSLNITPNNDALLQELYKNKNGFIIEAEETALIEKEGGNSTYGEITDKGVQILIDDLKLTKQDIFYDLGSGVGRMVTKVYLDSPVKKSVGIELSDSRHKQALHIKKMLEKKDKLEKNRALQFKKENILKSDIDDATVIYLASTCMSDEFMQQITDKLATLKKGLRVLTLRKLPEHQSFQLVKKYKIPMTWSKSVDVHLYKLK
ncbi:MAG: hypothetical protein WDZ41_04955 [Candidatus Babeliales bacterium]